MKSIVQIFKWVVYANFWIAIAAMLLTFQVSILFEYHISLSKLLFIFCSTLFAYNFQRLTRHGKILNAHDSNRVEWIKKNRTFILILTILSGISTMIFSFSLTWKELIFLAVPGLISLFYSMGKLSLRNIPSLKIIWICLVWSASASLVLVQQGTTNELIYSILYVFLYICSLCIPFDVRDIAIDDQSKKTIPQIIGIPKSLLISTLLAFSSFVIIFIQTHNYLFIFPLLLSVVLNILSKNPRKELFYSGLVDGHIIFTSLLIIIPYVCRN